MKIYNSVQDAYIGSLSDLNNHGIVIDSIKDKYSIGSNFGKNKRDFVELQGYSFTILNPRNRLIYSESRKISFGFCVANVIWFFSGNKEIQSISFYNKKSTAFSRNNLYYEAAFGDRVFGSCNLWASAFELLKQDPTSRRALIPLFFPNDLKQLPNDTPCASSIQIMIRNQKVDFFLHMRSQSVAMVFPYDIFLFTMLHEFISRALDLSIGKFHYYCNSFHYYNDESIMVDRIINEQRYFPQAMEEMCYTDNQTLNNIIKGEEIIRNSVLQNSDLSMRYFESIPVYWKDLLQVVYHKACIEHNVAPKRFDTKYFTNSQLYI